MVALSGRLGPWTNPGRPLSAPGLSRSFPGRTGIDGTAPNRPLSAIIRDPELRAAFARAYGAWSWSQEQAA